MHDFYPHLLRIRIYPLAQRFQHRDFPTMMEEANRNQHMSQDELQALQFHKLSALLDHAYQTVPHYREKFDSLGIKPDGIRTWEDFRRIPVLTKDEYRRETSKLISTRLRTPIYPLHTSGSTGSPTRFYLSQASSAAANISRIRALRWWGIDLGDREVRLSTDSSRIVSGFWNPVKRRWKRFYRDRLMNRRSFPSNELTPQFMEELWDFTLRYRPRYLFGYGSALYTLAEFLKQRGYDGQQLELAAVVTYAEALYKWQVDAIGEAFGCPVVDEYGATEVGVIAYSHPCGEYHTMDDFILVEIVKSRQEEKFGEIVVTLLENWGSPLIRYNLQDLAVPVEGGYPCPSGISLGRLGNIIGRTHDFIRLADGKVVHGQVFAIMMGFIPGVRRFQFVQKDLDLFELIVETDGDGLAAGDEHHIRTKLHQTLGQVELRITTVREIPVDSSGKFRYVRSEVKSAQSVQQPE
jgi:phenylacetate-CoA ligase